MHRIDLILPWRCGMLFFWWSRLVERKGFVLNFPPFANQEWMLSARAESIMRHVTIKDAWGFCVKSSREGPGLTQFPKWRRSLLDFTRSVPTYVKLYSYFWTFPVNCSGNKLFIDFSIGLQASGDQDMFDREDDEEILEVEKATLDVPISEVKLSLSLAMNVRCERFHRP